ncbi:MAG: hypothetical protein AVDCRST_MAG27-2747, partial [uncultured Craurococcus sp.]
APARPLPRPPRRRTGPGPGPGPGGSVAGLPARHTRSRARLRPAAGAPPGDRPGRDGAWRSPLGAVRALALELECRGRGPCRADAGGGHRRGFRLARARPALGRYRLHAGKPALPSGGLPQRGGGLRPGDEHPLRGPLPAGTAGADGELGGFHRAVPFRRPGAWRGIPAAGGAGAARGGLGQWRQRASLRPEPGRALRRGAAAGARRQAGRGRGAAAAGLLGRQPRFGTRTRV